MITIWFPQQFGKTEQLKSDMEPLRVCLKCGLWVAGQEMRSRVKKCGRGSRNAGHMLQDAGQLEQNAVTHLRLSKMRVAVAGREMQIASCGLRVARCELRLPNVEGLGNSMAYLCTFVTSLS